MLEKRREMKKTFYVLWLLFALPWSVKPDVSDNLSYLASYGSSALFPSLYFVDLNTSAAALRKSMKAAWWFKSWLPGQAPYSDLQEQYLYPPKGAVPQAVMDQLVTFNKTIVATSELPEFIADHPLRKGSDLGKKEQEFIAKRINVACKTFQKSNPTTIFSVPDTNLKKSPSPYGYALDIPLDEGADTPRIATCFSGGGFRAMIATLGFWQGVTDIGIVDSVLYSANLSGSTWCTIPWCVGASLRDLLATYQKYAKVSVGVQTATDLKNHIVPSINIRQVRDKFMSAFLWAQPLSSVRGLYGPLLGQMTLAAWDDVTLRSAYGIEMPYQSSQYLYFWQAMDFIKEGTIRPFPIATSLIPYKGNWNEVSTKIARRQKSSNGIWMEFNPESVGFEYFDAKRNLTGVFIPTFSLGRVFTQVIKEKSRWFRNIFTNPTILGYASEAAPAHTLDYWEGTWGSAFTVSPADIYRIFFDQVPPTDDESIDKLKSSSAISDRITGLLGSALGVTVKLGKETGAISNLNDVRLFPAVFNNFAPFEDSPIQASTFTAVDAGIDFNLPFPPLLRQSRALDLIVVGDWSAPTLQDPAKELRLAENWARVRGIPFPKIVKSAFYRKVYDNPMTLFNEYEEGKTGPAILYIPLMNNRFNVSDFNVTTCLAQACSTFNFDYFKKDGDKDRDSVKDLSDHIYRTVWGVYPQIREVVQNLVVAKNEAFKKNKPYGFTMTMNDMSSLESLTGAA
jgi:hypothetical protein